MEEGREEGRGRKGGKREEDERRIGRMKKRKSMKAKLEGIGRERIRMGEEGGKEIRRKLDLQHNTCDLTSSIFFSKSSTIILPL